MLEKWSDSEHPTGLDSWVPQVQRHIESLEALTNEEVINLSRPWHRARYKDLVKVVAGHDWFDVSPAERRRRAVEDLKLGGDIAAGYEDFEITGAVFEKLIEPTLIQP